MNKNGRPAKPIDEQKLAECLAKGQKAKQIAHVLGVSQSTARRYMNRVNKGKS